MAKPNLTPKRIAIDALGYLCILGSGLLGWLPGPGGIPLLLAGLGLLSINNDWAKRLLHFIRMRSESLRDVIFPDIPLIQWAWDIFVVLLIVGGTLISLYVENPVLKAAAIALYALSTTCFLFNRHRLHWIERRIRKRKQ